MDASSDKKRRFFATQYLDYHPELIYYERFFNRETLIELHRTVFAKKNDIQ